jgi:archaeosine synthase beta-subunit
MSQDHIENVFWEGVAFGYPTRGAERNRWIVSHRGPKNALDPFVPYAYLWEEERGPGGGMLPTVTLLLTNKECPYRCLMCDLWQNTLNRRVPVGAIPAQIRYALERLPAARQIKLYNAGSFFDPQAIPLEDDAAIARLIEGFERVIVECHPALIGGRCLQLSERIMGQLEVAIGLETVHPQVLDALNKRFTVADFQRKADFLAQNQIDLRVFLLVRPPFMNEAEGLEWARRSLDTAFEAGASACTLIPTRAGNGAMEQLAEAGLFAPPSLRSLEAAQEYGIGLRRGRVFADVWDVEKFFTCACSPARAARLSAMNREQNVPPPVCCDLCL